MMKKKKIIYFIFITLCFIIFVGKINASTINILEASFCQRTEVAKVIKLIVLFINIIRVVVPIILIISVMIKLVNAVTGKDGIDKVKKVIVVNVVSAVIIFLIPTFINILTKITGTYDLVQSCIKLSDNPTSTPGGKNDDPGNNNSLPSITSIMHKGSYVVVAAKPGNSGNITGYYFSKSNSSPNLSDDKWVIKSTNKLEIVKLPGTYYVFVKDSSNTLSKGVKLTITYNETYKESTKSRGGNYNPIVGDIDDALKSKGDSKANLDDIIAWSVKSAGLFTKEGVATAGISAQTYLHAKHNIHITYVSNINCFGQRYNVNFGSNPKWGHVIKLTEISREAIDYKTGEKIYPRQDAQAKGIDKVCKGFYGGLDCQSFFGWAVHNGGFKAENTHGSYTGGGKAKELTCGTSCSKAQVQSLLSKLVIGDEVINPAHVMLFLSFYDDNNDGIKDGIYVYESSTRVGMYKWSWAELHHSQYFKINKMENYYNNSKNYACLQNSQGNVVSIPDAWKDKASLFRKDCKA